MTEENQQQAEKDISLGRILYERRLDLKMEIVDASSFLKIKKRDIEAMESDNFDEITKHIYVPGLLFSYAKLLKIDAKIIAEKIKFLPIESNIKNKKHRLVNVGENLDLTPDKNVFFNFLLISALLFLILLSFYSFRADKKNLINSEEIISRFTNLSS